MEKSKVLLYDINNYISIINHTCRNKLGEGINLYNRNLQWVDIYDNSIYRYNLLNNELCKYYVEQYPSIFLPTNDPNYGIYSFQKGIMCIKYINGEKFKIYEEMNIPNDIRYNDGKCDKNGNLWIGNMNINNICNNNNSLLKMENMLGNRIMFRKIDKLSIPNGIDWYNDYMYHIDTPTQTVKTYDIGLRCINTIDLSNYMGVPDGMVIANGLIFIAMWDGSQILVGDLRTNEIIDKIDTPFSRPTSLAINENGFYITSNYIDNEPYSGYVVLIKSKNNYSNIIYPFNLS